jgi:hypothetical protein
MSDMENSRGTADFEVSCVIPRWGRTFANVMRKIGPLSNKPEEVERIYGAPLFLSESLFCSISEMRQGLRPYRLRTRRWMPSDEYKREEAEALVTDSLRRIKEHYKS